MGRRELTLREIVAEDLRLFEMSSSMKKLTRIELAKASLIAGLSLYGYKDPKKGDVAKYAKKWGIDLSKCKFWGRDGLDWTYPVEFGKASVDRWGSWLDEDDPESAEFNHQTDEFEYAFKLDGRGFDTSAGGDLNLLSSEVNDGTPTYTYYAGDFVIMEVVYTRREKKKKVASPATSLSAVSYEIPASAKVEPPEGMHFQPFTGLELLRLKPGAELILWNNNYKCYLEATFLALIKDYFTGKPDLAVRAKKKWDGSTTPCHQSFVGHWV